MGRKRPNYNHLSHMSFRNYRTILYTSFMTRSFTFFFLSHDLRRARAQKCNTSCRRARNGHKKSLTIHQFLLENVAPIEQYYRKRGRFYISAKHTKWEGKILSPFRLTFLFLAKKKVLSLNQASIIKRIREAEEMTGLYKSGSTLVPNTTTAFRVSM